LPYYPDDVGPLIAVQRTFFFGLRVRRRRRVLATTTAALFVDVLMEMYCILCALRLAIIRGYRREKNVCGRFGLFQTATSGSLIPRLGSVRKRILNIPGLGKAIHARWPASVEPLETQHRILLQEQWGIMKKWIIDQMPVYYYALVV
jgi:hypothetical protein